jgi:hypothetical protein
LQEQTIMRDRNLSCLSGKPGPREPRSPKPPIIRAAHGHWKPADLRQTQIRMIENFKLFRTLAADPNSGNS